MNNFFNTNCDVLPINGQYHGASCFLIMSGPSLKTLDLSKLRQPGIVTFGVNNSPCAYRPNLWCSVDDPANFVMSIWLDPLIQKFVMYNKRDKLLWDNEAWKQSRYIVKDCPNVTYYKDNEHFQPDTWLNEDTINWGDHTDRCECGFIRQKDANGKKIHTCTVCGGKKFGARSVMLAAMKIIYLLGFKKVFIIGADFKMSEQQTYAFNQERSQHSINSNSDTYSRLNERFNLLRPIFERNNFYVFNATPDSGLNSFIKVDYNDAIEMATKDFPRVQGERTFGMYERKACDKHVDENAHKLQDLESQITKVNGSDPRLTKKLNHKIDKIRAKLQTAIVERERLLTWKA